MKILTRRVAVCLWTHCNIVSKTVWRVLPIGEWRWTVKQGRLCGLIAPKPYVAHKNSLTKGTSLGCRLVPQTITIARNCAVWAVALSQTPLESTHFSCFWDLAVKPLAHKCRIFYRCTHADTDSRILFQKRSKSVQDKCPEFHVVLVTKNKYFLASL